MIIEDISINIRNLIAYCQKPKNHNKLIKDCINNIKCEFLNYIFQDYLYDKYIDVDIKIHEIYSEFTNKMIPIKIKSSNVKYKKFKLIKSNYLCNVYEAVMNNKFEQNYVIIKCYFIDLPIEIEFNESKILKLLNEKNLNIPKIYDNFTSIHFNCYPMEKLTTTLDMILKQKLIDEKDEGLDIKDLYKLLYEIVKILYVLHNEYKYLYVDFSTNNIGIKKDEFYMFDFGAVVKISNDSKAITYTKRYCSIKSILNKTITIYDDFESISFLLLDAYYGYYKSPFPNKITIESKLNLLNEMKNGIHGDFFSRYIHIISKHDKPYEILYNFINLSYI